MADPISLGERIRSWTGHDLVDPERYPFLRKLGRAEADVALLRLLVATIVVLAFLASGVQGGPASPAAAAVLVLSFAYAVGLVVLREQPAFGKLPWSVGTVLLDTLAITAWLTVTGGWASAYFPLWYVSIAAVGYRWNLPLTTAVSVVYVAAYAGLCVATDGVASWIDFGVRSLLIPVTGAIVGLASEGFVEREHKHDRAHRRLQEAIHAMDRRLSAILESAPDRIVVTDAEGHVEFANGPLASLGFQASDGGRCARGLHRTAITSAVETRTAVDYVAGPDGVTTGERFWCRVSPVEADGRAVGAVLIAREASEGFEEDSIGDRRGGGGDARGDGAGGPDGPEGPSRPSDPQQGFSGA